MSNTIHNTAQYKRERQLHTQCTTQCTITKQCSVQTRKTICCCTGLSTFVSYFLPLNPQFGMYNSIILKRLKSPLNSASMQTFRFTAGDQMCYCIRQPRHVRKTLRVPVQNRQQVGLLLSAQMTRLNFDQSFDLDLWDQVLPWTMQ